LPVVSIGPAALRWHANPSSPLGECVASDEAADQAAVRVLDCAYQPLKIDRFALGDHAAWRANDPAQNGWWQLWTPNKALGLTGVRAAYAIAPAGSEAAVDALSALCPSWLLGSHGVALLQAWVQADVQLWLAQSRHTLVQWKLRQVHVLQALGWQCLPSDTNYFVAKPPLDLAEADPAHALAKLLHALRTQGIKLRDTSSFGLPGHVRWSVQPPQSQDALVRAWKQYVERTLVTDATI
jgi:histidinol-phosphate aminotransferase